MSERIRREVRELVDGFGPPRPGLAARAAAGLPDRRGRSVTRWAVAAAAALAVATGLLFWTARSLPRQAGPVPAGVAALERRPLAPVPLAGPACQVDQQRATVVQSDTTVTHVNASGAPPDDLVMVRSVYKPQVSSTVGVTAGPAVSGPVLIRGRRLDGPGTLLLAMAPAAPVHGELTVAVSPALDQWDVRLQASVPGCYAIQFDGARFSEQAVLQLWPPAPTSLQQTMDPAQARDAVRAAVTATRPILLPTAIVADWRTEVSTTRDSFQVRYEDPADATRTVTVAIGASAASGAAALSYPTFRGDARSVYALHRGSRILLWHQTGVYDRADPSYPGVPYELVTTGLSEVELWQVAGSLG